MSTAPVILILVEPGFAVARSPSQKGLTESALAVRYHGARLRIMLVYVERRGRQLISEALNALRRLVPLTLRFVVWQRRMLKSRPELSSRDVERMFSQIARRIDVRRLERLRLRHRQGRPDDIEACDFQIKLRVAIVKALVAGLDTREQLQILDVGSGGGYFVAVCRHLGHAAIGTEVPREHHDATVAQIYDEISAALGCPCATRLRISAYEPLSLTGTYDLITAHKICFNDHLKPTEWSVPEWRFFLSDAMRLLRPGGELVLDLNENVERYGARRWYDEDLLELFSSVGRISGNVISARVGHQT